MVKELENSFQIKKVRIAFPFCSVSFRKYNVCHDICMKGFFFFASFIFLSQNVYSQDNKGVGSLWFKVLTERESLLTKGSPSGRELNSKIKALVWNIKKAELKNWKQEFIKFGTGKDLFVVQEAYETDVFHSTINTFDGFEWKLGASFLYKKYANAATGTLVGSQVEASEVLVKHSPDFEPIVGTPKSSTFAKFPISGKNLELLVVSVHGINFETTGAFKRQMMQIEKEINKHSGPVLLAGDFNTWNHSRTSFLNSLAKKLNLTEAPYNNGDARMSFGGHFLDHVFTRGAVVNSAEVVAESEGSDHKPFLLELTIP